MSDRDHFIAAILAEPDDDSPRLIFSDWLEEQGDPEWELYRRGSMYDVAKTLVSGNLDSTEHLIDQTGPDRLTTRIRATLSERWQVLAVIDPDMLFEAGEWFFDDGIDPRPTSPADIRVHSGKETIKSLLVHPRTGRNHHPQRLLKEAWVSARGPEGRTLSMGITTIPMPPPLPELRPMRIDIHDLV